MKKPHIYIIVCIVLLLGLVLLFKSDYFEGDTPIYSIGTVSMKGKTFSVEISDTEKLRTLGLSGHVPLKDDEGMLFIFPKPDKYGFWMKDMQFPIDIIWIDENFMIISIEKSVLPTSYPKVFYPTKLAPYVLELSEGEAQKLDLKPGENVKFTKK
jgi:uncharacterized membrane protein (UPF0127 family)